MTDGWISINRSIKNHWIFSDAENLRSWLTILIDVNHSEQRVLIGKEVVICKRGESYKSLETWGKLFGNWSKTKTKRFFDLLKREGMIETENVTKTTRLSVCNYDKYQDSRNAFETEVKRKRNAFETEVKRERATNNNDLITINNDNNILPENTGTRKKTIEERKIDFENSLNQFESEFGKTVLNEFLEYWTESNAGGLKMRFEMQKVFDCKKRLATWKRNNEKNNFKKNESVVDRYAGQFEERTLNAIDDLFLN